MWMARIFKKIYLQTNSTGSSPTHLGWLPEEEKLAFEIGKGREGGEETCCVSLLRLLNCISKRIFNTIATGNTERDALVFHSARKFKFNNPFREENRTPNIVALWEVSRVFPAVNYSLDHPTPTTWSAFAAVGGVEASQSKPEDMKYRLSNYLQNHLCHPELNGVLGFTSTPMEYALFYHDADVIQRAGFGWDQAAPLYAFVEKLYTRPFQDTSMQIVDARCQDPAWATKIGRDIYVSQSPRALAGPGQRRYTTRAQDPSDSAVFIKDIWRDEGQLLSETSLFEQAHVGDPLPGLMRVDSHTFVFDASGERTRTTDYQPQTRDGRYKMRLMTKEIGGPLEKVRSLRRFLSVMYDACAVQRNLYRKSRILHRDISDTNIMVAPNTKEYLDRCSTGFTEVKFINQVLAREKKCDPKPACLLIDLGNGVDLKVPPDAVSLRERTGTPKFIARSISFGKLLPKADFGSAEADLPSMETLPVDYCQFMHTMEYQHATTSGHGSALQSDVQFTHRLLHDAESTFWVIVWTLARSTVGSSTTTDDPSEDFCTFFHTMASHYPKRGHDPREALCEGSEDYWKDILHPDLGFLSAMLNKMYVYIRPEWAYRPELNPEHVHEALMRLILAEIVGIDDNDADLPLVIGGRLIPPIDIDTFVSTINTSSAQPSISFPHSLKSQQRTC
ncbi:unnamed protein product [Rhizoctonia solani]|uniref:Fungal-type protein kinase domain-containing protein n=1 Tax=Rhizoctonia solani TaxID=456999 RepID=A0A8H2Y0Z2_9AGAM|nr:unnamed protein product [Rhizoctonia solani]